MQKFINLVKKYYFHSNFLKLNHTKKISPHKESKCMVRPNFAVKCHAYYTFDNMRNEDIMQLITKGIHEQTIFEKI